MANPTGTDGTVRWQWVKLLFGTTPAEVTTGNPLPVAVISGGAVATEYTEDAAAAADPVGGMGMLVAVDTPANRVADGDNVANIGTRKGEQRVAAKLVDASYADIVLSVATLTVGQNALSVSNEVVIAANSARLFAEVKNADAAINVYLGKDNTVTTANGHLLKPGESFSFEGYTGAIWAIAASGTPNVTFIEW